MATLRPYEQSASALINHMEKRLNEAITWHRLDGARILAKQARAIIPEIREALVREDRSVQKQHMNEIKRRQELERQVKELEQKLRESEYNNELARQELERLQKTRMGRRYGSKYPSRTPIREPAPEPEPEQVSEPDFEVFGEDNLDFDNIFNTFDDIDYQF